jgi:3-phytase
MATVNGTANSDVLFIEPGKSNDTLLGLAGNDYLDALPGAGNNILRGGDGNDELYGYIQDQLYGEAGQDTLTSDGNGTNTLSGGEGNDTIYADRNDIIFGDSGDDTIFGGLGGNTISGGAGKDVFWLANAAAPTTPNTIGDFDRLNDTIRIDLAGVTKFSDLTIGKSGNDATISFGTQQLAVLSNTDSGSLNSNTVVLDPKAPNNLGSNVTSYEFKNLPKLGTTSKGQDIFLGGFSGLYFQGIATNGNLKFVTHTDRGPNGDPTGANRPFYLPSFQPEIVSFELNRTAGDITITKRTGLFRADGKTPLTGLPNLQAGANGLAYTDEIGVDLDGKVLANDPFGADVEGIVVAPNGEYWMVDEYRPAIYRFDVNGKLLDRFIPKGTAVAPTIDLAVGTFGTEVLPEVYAQRRSNRGFEAVAIEGSKLYAFIQSPIDNPDNAGDTASRASRNLRILEFDTVTKTVTGEYLYLLDNITASGNAKTDKLGDAVSLGNGKFAVVERDDLATTASNKLIYQIDLAGATNIGNPANFILPSNKTIEQLTPAELTAAKIAPVSKNLIVNAAQAGYTGVEKLEGLALVSPNTLALINDNDFNVAGGNVPEKLGILELAKNLPISTAIFKSTAPKLEPLANNTVRVTADLSTNLVKFSPVSRQGTSLDEVGVFTVDDAQGRIDGLLPDTAGYLKAAMDRSQVIFSTLTGSFFDPTAIRSLNLAANQNIRFYAISGGTTDDIEADIAAGKTPSNLRIGTASDLQITSKGDTIGLNWLKLDSKIVLQADVSNTPITVGTTLQGKQDLLDLRNIDRSLQADFTLKSDASYRNQVGFYAVDDALTGRIGTLQPGQAGYAEAAIKNSVVNLDRSQSTFSQSLNGNRVLAPYLIANGTVADFLVKNPTNQSTQNVQAYFAYLGANSDKVDHIRLLGDNRFGFEDLFGGGDRDFNDIVLQVKFT